MGKNSAVGNFSWDINRAATPPSTKKEKFKYQN
jgi:hypothetical protein